MKGFIYDKQDVLFGNKDIIGFGDKDFYIIVVDRNIIMLLIYILVYI